MHKNVIICTCMIINNLALRSGGAVVRKRKAIKNNEKKRKENEKRKKRVHSTTGGKGKWRGSRWGEREREERVALRAFIRRIKVSVRVWRTPGCREEKRAGGGGLAAAVTSSFMNSLYFCSVQINVRSCWKKWQKNTKHDHLSRILHSTPTVSRVAVQILRFDQSYRIFRRSNKVSIA